MDEVEVEVVRLNAGWCQDFTSAAVGVFDLSACSNLPSILSLYITTIADSSTAPFVVIEANV